MSAHGTDARYKQHCRCESCRAAHTAADKARRQRRLHDPRLGMVHGKRSTYNNQGCRCELCRAAKSAYDRDLFRRNREAGPS